MPAPLQHKESSNDTLHDDASSSNRFDGAIPSSMSIDSATEETPKQQLRRKIFPILQCFFAVALMGLQDGNFGVILPRIRASYGVSDGLVSILFLLQAGGYFVMAFCNGLVVAKIGQKGALYLGASLMLVSYILLLFGFPFPAMGCIMIILGCGLALTNAGTNVYIITAPYRTIVLNLLHASYGTGALIGPLMSSALLAKDLRWEVSYMILAGVASLNLIGMIACFWHTKIDTHDDPAIESLALNPESTSRPESMIKQALRQRITQVGAFYLLFYVGTEVTFGSWSFTFLTEVRGGDPVHLAQVTSGYWAGLTFGRLFLGAVTAHFGENRMVALYLIITCMMIVVVWQVTAIAGDIFGLVVIGMALGPMFPTTISVASQVLPKHLHTTVIGFLAALGQGGAALFPFITGEIASTAGVIGMMPFTLALTVSMLISWIFMPNVGPPLWPFSKKRRGSDRGNSIVDTIVVDEEKTNSRKQSLEV
ncbi:hypothetical protein INT43_002848 [Umbelopsis isabellina]|uniref:Major facilitator superfamily (MFS) profile domain-containing protein n=1 Tax=Mortierella isabellina TaxID=91625 RepID=A0A8H7UKE8_MORIS|nr:hypothetical protein INT43_002848 [Umbelopsis isabellina]